MADGSITFNTALDNAQLEKDFAKLEKKVSALEDKLSKQNNARNPLAEKAAQIGTELDRAKAKMEQMKADKAPAEAISQQVGTVKALQSQFNEADSALRRMDSNIKATTASLGEARDKAAEIQQELLAASEGVGGRIKATFIEIGTRITAAFAGAFAAIGKLGGAALSMIRNVAGKILTTVKGMNVFSKLSDAIGGKLQRLGRMISRAFVFTVVQKGLRDLRDRVGAYLSTNKELTAALQRMNAALATAFQPIFQAALPALRALIDVVTRAATAIATLTASMFGQTQKQAAGNAKALSAEADALEKAGGAAEDATKSMAGFDEINQLSDNSKSGGGTESADFSGLDNATVFDSWGEAFNAFIGNVLAGIPSLNKAFDGFATSINAISKKLLEAFTFSGVQEKVSRLGIELAAAFNGLVTKIDWLTLGAAFGAGLNTALGFMVSFLYTFDWLNLGSSLANLVNGALAQINWKDFGALLWAGWKIAIETLAGFLLNLDMQELAKAASDTAIGFFNSISETIQRIDWKKLGEQVKDFLVNVDWAGVATSVFEAIGSAFGAAAAFLWGLIEEAWQKVVNWWHEKAFEDGKFTLLGLLEGIVEVIANIGAWIKENIFDPFIEGFKKVFGIHSPSTVMAEQGKYIMEGLCNGITALIDFVAAPFTTIKERAEEILGGIIKFVTGVFTADWETAWDGVKDVFKGVWNSIVGTLESAVNLIIDGINWVISKLNTINFEMPDWVPLVGGKSFGINIPSFSHIDIPRLAQGAVIPPNRKFLAVLGDQTSGTNIEAPLATMVQAFEGAAMKLAGAIGGGDVKVVFEGDLAALGRVLHPHITREGRRLGTNFVIGGG